MPRLWKQIELRATSFNNNKKTTTYRLNRALDGREHHTDDRKVFRIRVRCGAHVAEYLARRLRLLQLAGHVDVRSNGGGEQTDGSAQAVAHHAGHERLEEAALEYRVDEFLFIGFDRHRSQVLRDDDLLAIARQKKVMRQSAKSIQFAGL